MTPTTKRSVVITGGGTGIGAATAELFAKTGHDVTITGRRSDVLATTAKRLGVTHAAFDAADPAAVQTALDQLPTTIDVLVNNAGGNTDRRRPPVAAGDLVGVADAWRANFEANVLTTVLVTEALKPRLADGARIVTVGSVAAKQGSGSYGAAKAALEAWNVETARTLGSRGITANVVAPGVTLDTEFFAGDGVRGVGRGTGVRRVQPAAWHPERDRGGDLLPRQARFRPSDRPGDPRQRRRLCGAVTTC